MYKSNLFYNFIPIQAHSVVVACRSGFFSSFKTGIIIAEYAILNPTAMWKEAAKMQAEIYKFRAIYLLFHNIYSY